MEITSSPDEAARAALTVIRTMITQIAKFKHQGLKSHLDGRKTHFTDTGAH